MFSNCCELEQPIKLQQVIFLRRWETIWCYRDENLYLLQRQEKSESSEFDLIFNIHIYRSEDCNKIFEWRIWRHDDKSLRVLINLLMEKNAFRHQNNSIVRAEYWINDNVQSAWICELRNIVSRASLNDCFCYVNRRLDTAWM